MLHNPFPGLRVPSNLSEPRLRRGVESRYRGGIPLTKSDQLCNTLFFFAHRGRELVLLHMFAKKTRAMPRHEIALAERRRKDWLRREDA